VDLNNLSAAQGFRIDGEAQSDQLPRSLAISPDMSGDGLGEIVTGASFADHPDPNTITSSGSVYVVFGKAGSGTVALASLGSRGFRVDGQGTNQGFGREMGLAGDVNGDGLPDIVAGALFAQNNNRVKSGSIYVIFGRSATSTIDLNNLGTQGFRVDGALADDYFGRGAGGAGDFNGDGRADVVGGAENASNNGTHSGSAYVVLGFGQPSVAYASPVAGTVGLPLNAAPSSVKRTGAPTFAVAPALPAGLSLDAATGAISGTPTAASPAADYTVTMTDLAGSATTGVNIKIDAGAQPQPQPQSGPKPGACANAQTGTRKRDRLIGTAFGDLIRGAAGNDTIRGLAGADCLFGQAGNDTLDGGSGNDKLDGGAGKDKLTGGRGRDTFKAGTGNDTVNAKDGIAEKIDCGRGRDKVKADKRDKLKGCEKRV
jgi:Ca2+-binding RTX toxin-like protein